MTAYGRVARLVVAATTACLVLGSTATPVAAEDQIGPTATVCANSVNDPEPRFFGVSTDEGGGHVIGFVWVQRRSDGHGYNVCVGWYNDDPPFPWQAVVEDTKVDDHGAVAYVTYIPWGSSTRRYHDWKRADGAGHQAGWNAVYAEVSGFYAGVCRIRQDVKTDCADEGGTR